ncbi:DUF1127 domain-containing protein [Roseibium sp. SCP14]|uniref:DUF1127 domain-containing protein n=1 Tax=Roseibium sp. SCP14 TaxID=3141375 RepID=UPI0033386EF6
MSITVIRSTESGTLNKNVKEQLFARKLIGAIGTALRRRANRDILEKLDEDRLKDIGINPEDVKGGKTVQVGTTLMTSLMSMR